MRSPLVLGALLASVMALAISAAPSPAAVAAAAETPGWRMIARARAHFRASLPALALASADSALASGEGRRDPALARMGRLFRGSSLALLNRPAEAEPIMRSLARTARASADSVTLAPALRYLGYSLGMLGRASEGANAYRELLALSRARRDTLNQGYAHLGLAYGALLEDRFAEGAAGYRRAIPLFRARGEGFLVRSATVGLARCDEGLGRLDEARSLYLELDSLCTAAGDAFNRSAVLNNLGALEHTDGDLAAAERHYRAAYQLHADAPDNLAAVPPANNLALVQIERGRLREASLVIEDALRRTRGAGQRLETARVLNRLAELRAEQRRIPEAQALVREGLALAATLAAADRAQLLCTAGATLRRAGAMTEAIRVLETGAGLLTDGSRAVVASELLLELSRCLALAGRHADAQRAALRVVPYARRSGGADLEFRARVGAGLAQLELGRVNEGREALEEATRLWEANRRRQLDPETREHLSAVARGCASGLVTAQLAGQRPAECAPVFSIIERFKARTLRERMQAPRPFAADEQPAVSAPTLAGLQRDVLREGELFLQMFAGPSARVMVAVTRHEARLVTLPAGEPFGERLSQFASLCAAPPPRSNPDARFVTEAGSRLGATILGPVRDLLAGCSRVILSPDDALGAFPWSALSLPADGTDRPAIALVERELVLAPSAAILADLRARPGAQRTNASLRTLALAGRTSGHDDTLPGAAREVRRLASEYAGVDAPGERLAMADLPGRLEQYDALHLAAHTTMDDQYPGRSSIRLGAPAATGEEHALRADRVARLRLRARLAVLSSCESAAGRVVSGEGVVGLSTAFLSAGASSTVATLWPVGDAVTERLMRSFYRELASGRSVSQSLRTAQADIRGGAATRHPFYWAGFVVIGDGDVRLPLRRRFPMASSLLAGLLAAGIVWWGVRKSGRGLPMTNRAAGTPSR
ncbi:MAG: CHAT domain-containing protein [Candidatus Eisenbacteria bacterium]|nr:CHAT domain-containing protein [Candidatus Eisenbacteria bacterium]